VEVVSLWLLRDFAEEFCLRPCLSPPLSHDHDGGGGVGGHGPVEWIPRLLGFC